MTLSTPGTDTLASSITGINTLGLYILVEEKEYFIPFDHYPAFRKATLEQIFNYMSISRSQFSWPDLDCDIELEALEEPEQFPLQFT